MIHFVTCRLRHQVHTQGQGFTNVIYLYTWGSDPSEAERHARAYLAGQDLEIDAISPARPAANQSLQRFAYPEQIYGLPEDVAAGEIRSRGYPDEILKSTMASLLEKQHFVRRGLEKLQVAA